MKYKLEDKCLTVFLEGHIDSTNSKETEDELSAIRAANPSERIELDLTELRYISSAGLRVILRLKQAFPVTVLVNVPHQVYEILEMTGFTEIMEVRKGFVTVSVAGCEVIGEGANGTVYRIERDTVVKVYKSSDALEEIRKERELARTAFVLGVPTAIPYDVVRIEGGGYGSVFELLNATNFAKLLTRGEKSVDELAAMSVELLKIIHGTRVDPHAMPSMREQALSWAKDLQPWLSPDRYEKLLALFTAVPEDDHLLHGDYHIRNITRQGDENLILDMDTLCHGHPIFELGSMYNAYRGFADPDPSVLEGYLGVDCATAAALWDKTLRCYLNTEDEQRLRSVEDKAALVGYTRLLRRSIRRNGFGDAAGRAAIECYRTRLAELLDRVDSLVF